MFVEYHPHWNGTGRQELVSYLIVNVPKTRIEVQIFSQHTVIYNFSPKQ